MRTFIYGTTSNQLQNLRYVLKEVNLSREVGCNIDRKRTEALVFVPKNIAVINFVNGLRFY